MSCLSELLSLETSSLLHELGVLHTWDLLEALNGPASIRGQVTPYMQHHKMRTLLSDKSGWHVGPKDIHTWCKWGWFNSRLSTPGSSVSHYALTLGGAIALAQYLHSPLRRKRVAAAQKGAKGIRERAEAAARTDAGLAAPTPEETAERAAREALPDAPVSGKEVGSSGEASAKREELKLQSPKDGRLRSTRDAGLSRFADAFGRAMTRAMRDMLDNSQAFVELLGKAADPQDGTG